MALTNCPECGKELSDKATTCIHCGANVVLCSECNRLVLAGEVCSYCGAPLSVEKVISETKPVEESVKEKKGKNKLKLTNVQKEKVYREINKKPEVQELKKKEIPYIILDPIWGILIGVIIVLGFRISFAHLFGMGRIVMLVLSGVAAIALAIVKAVMSNKEKALKDKIKKQFAKEYQAAIEEFKKDPSKIPTNEKEIVQKTADSEKLTSILSCIGWGAIALFVVSIFLPLIKVGNENESIVSLGVEFIDKVFIKKVDVGALLAYFSRDGQGNGVDIPHLLYYIAYVVMAIIVAISAVIGFIVNISLVSDSSPNKDKKENDSMDEEGSDVGDIIEANSYGAAIASSKIVIDGGLLIGMSTAFFVFYDLAVLGCSINAFAYIIPAFAMVVKVVLDIVCNIIEDKQMKERMQ